METSSAGSNYTSKQKLTEPVLHAMYRNETWEEYDCDFKWQRIYQSEEKKPT